jgi:serine/threonine protein kinase
VVVGVARGLLYLHEDAHTPIMHHDIKANDILLDDHWVANIADFGTDRLYPKAGDGHSHVQTRVAGFMAPEYLMHGHLSAKAAFSSWRSSPAARTPAPTPTTSSTTPGSCTRRGGAWSCLTRP